MGRLSPYEDKLPREVVKLQDVQVLRLENLQGLGSTTFLQIFFEQVELCSTDDATRI